MRVQVQGVPAYGLIDSGADITIIGGSLFKKVVTVARLKKRDLKKADRIPRTYDQQLFTLAGRMNLQVTFGDKQMTTTVYIKMDAHDQLLLSEGVCRQLGVFSYHPDVERWRGGQQRTTPKTPETQSPSHTCSEVEVTASIEHQGPNHSSESHSISLSFAPPEPGGGCVPSLQWSGTSRHLHLGAVRTSGGPCPHQCPCGLGCVCYPYQPHCMLNGVGRRELNRGSCAGHSGLPP